MSDKPLRVRIRRDGEVCVVDANGSMDSPDRAFPDSHLFTVSWLLGPGSSVTRLDGDTLHLTMANGTAEYRITARTERGVEAELVTSELRDAAPIDEHRAFEIQLERRDREVGELVEKFGVDAATAESLAVHFGVIPAPPAEWQADQEVAE